MANVQMLKGKIVERGLNTRSVADALGVHVSSLYRRFDDEGSSFSVGEANKICKLLQLTPEEATNIFFDQFVAWYATKKKRGE